MEKDFTTFERQIEILKERNLKFGSEETALAALRRFGYYNIINGYKDQYVEIIDGVEKYKDGVTFEQIYSLYNLDKSIRNAVMEAVLEVEDILRTATAHIIAENFGAKESEYINRKNYRLGKKRGSKYPLDSIFDKFNKILNDDSQPYKHYRETYGNIPPWILLKGASFGNIANFIKLQQPEIKNKIISLVYDVPESAIKSLPPFKELFMDTVFVSLDYRNRAAHGGRMYNYNTPATFRFNRILHTQFDISEADYRVGKGHTGLKTFARSLFIFDNKSTSTKLLTNMFIACRNHIDTYPKDLSFLDEIFDYSEIASTIK